MEAGTSILACDIGGTHITVAAVECKDDAYTALDIVEYESRAAGSIYSALDNALSRFEFPRMRYAGIAVSAAGIVEDTRCTLSNLPWTIDSRELEQYYNKPIALMNDFTAISYALPLIALDDTATVAPLLQRDPRTERMENSGPRAVVGAGTGLGVSAMLSSGGQYICLDSEAGHVDISPFDTESLALYEHYITELNNPPGAEYFVSGPGIARIFYFFVKNGSFPENDTYRNIMDCEEQKRPECISMLAEQDPHCKAVMRMFVRLYARVASNIAITFSATGGMFLAGGIARKIMPLLQEEFAEHFLRNYHPHLQRFLCRIPVFVICNYHISALGAAHAAIVKYGFR